MKTIGIIGGMSPESTVLYYQIINRETNRRLGGNRSAKILLDSVDFEEIVRLQKSGDWAAAGNVLAQSARKLEAGGADFLLLATNTMHKVAPAIEQAAGASPCCTSSMPPSPPSNGRACPPSACLARALP